MNTGFVTMMQEQRLTNLTAPMQFHFWHCQNICYAGVYYCRLKLDLIESRPKYFLKPSALGWMFLCVVYTCIIYLLSDLLAKTYMKVLDHLFK
jgi:hypothetical protein